MTPPFQTPFYPLGRQPDDERRRQLLSPWLSSASSFWFGCRQAIRIRASWPGARFAPALRRSPANSLARSLAGIDAYEDLMRVRFVMPPTIRDVR